MLKLVILVGAVSFTASTAFAEIPKTVADQLVGLNTVQKMDKKCQIVHDLNVPYRECKVFADKILVTSLCCPDTPVYHSDHSQTVPSTPVVTPPSPPSGGDNGDNGGDDGDHTGGGDDGDGNGDHNGGGDDDGWHYDEPPGHKDVDRNPENYHDWKTNGRWK